MTIKSSSLSIPNATAIIDSTHSNKDIDMANLLVRNVDSRIVAALKQRAGDNGTSAEAEHRQILEQALLKPQKRSLSRVILDMPQFDVGDEYFNSVDDNEAPNVFD